MCDVGARQDPGQAEVTGTQRETLSCKTLLPAQPAAGFCLERVGWAKARARFLNTAKPGVRLAHQQHRYRSYHRWWARRTRVISFVLQRVPRAFAHPTRVRL